MLKQLLLVLGLLHLGAANNNITEYAFLQDGNFEVYGSWKINPIAVWCNRWCSLPSEWSQKAKIGDNYILLKPETTAVLRQSFNYTTLGIDYYKYCNFNIYVRAIKPINIVFNVIWGGVTIPLDWKAYTKDSKVVEGEYTRLNFVLNGMSSKLELRLTTGDGAWLSLDDANMTCYESAAFNITEFEIALLLIGVVVIYAVLYTLYSKTGFKCGSCVRKFCPCCACCTRPARFVVLNGDDADSTEEGIAIDTELREFQHVEPHQLNSPQKQSTSSADSVERLQPHGNPNPAFVHEEDEENQ